MFGVYMCWMVRQNQAAPFRADRARRGVAPGHDRRPEDVSRQSTKLHCGGFWSRAGIFVGIGLADGSHSPAASSPIRRIMQNSSSSIIEVALTLSIGSQLGMLAAGPPERVRRAMNSRTLFGLAGRPYRPRIVRVHHQPEPLRKILAFNLLGGGAFLFFGVVANAARPRARRRSGAAGADDNRHRRRLRCDRHGIGADDADLRQDRPATLADSSAAAGRSRWLAAAKQACWSSQSCLPVWHPAVAGTRRTVSSNGSRC